jgi:hypothetical protein
VSANTGKVHPADHWWLCKARDLSWRPRSASPVANKHHGSIVFKTWRALFFSHLLLPSTLYLITPQLISMRVFALFALALATKALAQASSSESEPILEPTSTLVLVTDSDTEIIITPTPTPTPTPTTTTPPPIVSTAAPPIGGGATCVQKCLADAASKVGCTGGADLQCICTR